MFIKTVILAAFVAVFVSADVVHLAAYPSATYIRSHNLPVSRSAYSSSIIQQVADDGHGLSYSTVQTHGAVAPIVGARLISPVIGYNVGAYQLPISNFGFLAQNPAVISAGGLSGLVPQQQIEPDTQPASGSQNAPALSSDSSSDNDDDSVTIEAN